MSLPREWIPTEQGYGYCLLSTYSLEQWHAAEPPADTKDNIADVPSREDEPVILRSVNARFLTPVLAEGCKDADAWAVLQERWR